MVAERGMRSTSNDVFWGKSVDVNTNEMILLRTAMAAAAPSPHPVYNSGLAERPQMTNTSCLPSSLRGAIGLFPFETLKFEAGWITQQTSSFVARKTHQPSEAFK